MNRTELRHRLLTAVDAGSVAQICYAWAWSDIDAPMTRPHAAALSHLRDEGWVKTNTDEPGVWGTVWLTPAGKDTLAEWDCQFGVVPGANCGAL